MKKIMILTLITMLAIFTSYSHEALHFNSPSGGESYAKGDSMSLILSNYDESIFYELSYWNAQDRSWSLLHDSIQISSEQFRIKLPNITGSYFRFKITNIGNSEQTFSNYFSLKSTTLEKRIYETFVENKGEIKIFPNPALSSFEIETFLKVFKIKLYTIEGIELPIIIDGKTVMTKGIPSGMYFLFLDTENGIKTEKIIIL